MKKLILGLTLLAAALAAYALINIDKQNSMSRSPAKERPRLAATAWAKKATYKKPDPNSWNPLEGQKRDPGPATSTETAGRLLGVEIKLPKSNEAAAAGPAQIYGGKNATETAAKRGTYPRPAFNETGGSIAVHYPNGLDISMTLRNPDDKTRDYRGHVEQINKDIRDAQASGWFTDGAFWELTTVNGLEGMQTDKGFNGAAGDPNKEPRPAVVVWYDPAAWIEYQAYGPIDVSLSELRKVVDSIY